MKKIIIILLLSCSLIGCHTLYHLENRTGGYGETKLGDNVWKVYFSFNKHTTDERASDYLRLRCAEITIYNEFRYFQMSDLSTDPVQGLTKNGEKFYSNEQLSKSCMMTSFKEMPEKGTTYEAKKIIESIKDKYNMP